MPLNVLYCDSDIILVDKPANLSVTPDGWESNADYLIKLLEKEYGKVWVVHRLDKTTSGVMVFARTPEAHRDLSMQFEKHEAHKVYHAIVVGVPKWDDKIARHPLRVNVGHKHRTMVDDKNGKPSETRFKILKRFPAYVLLEAELMTGRTHQIRVHAYVLGHPLLGDLLYSAPETNLIARPALHAYSLSFIHPQTKEQLAFTAPYPLDFETALKNL